MTTKFQEGVVFTGMPAAGKSTLMSQAVMLSLDTPAGQHGAGMIPIILKVQQHRSTVGHPPAATKG